RRAPTNAAAPPPRSQEHWPAASATYLLARRTNEAASRRSRLLLARSGSRVPLQPFLKAWTREPHLPAGEQAAGCEQFPAAAAAAALTLPDAVFISASSRPHGSKAIPPGASGRLCGPSARSWTYVAARQSLHELGLSLRALGRLDEAQGHWLHALTIFEELQAAGTDQISRPARCASHSLTCLTEASPLNDSGLGQACPPVARPTTRKLPRPGESPSRRRIDQRKGTAGEGPPRYRPRFGRSPSEHGRHLRARAPSIRQIRATRRAERLLRRVSFSCWPGAIGCVCVWWSGSGMVRGGAGDAGGAGLREVHGGCIAID